MSRKAVREDGQFSIKIEQGQCFFAITSMIFLHNISVYGCYMQKYSKSLQACLLTCSISNIEYRHIQHNVCIKVLENILVKRLLLTRTDLSSHGCFSCTCSCLYTCTSSCYDGYLTVVGVCELNARMHPKYHCYATANSHEPVCACAPYTCAHLHV